ncbi:MAG: DUF4301 family protein [Paludibacteraceae bacterium]|nr:DUF4301 family protein [Paludibacteraceae bacterium]
MNTSNLNLLATPFISTQKIEEQLNAFKTGFPFLKISKAAEIGDGILKINEKNIFLSAWETYLSKNNTVIKFVPASGAASRMFKDLFEFLDADYNEPEKEFEKYFFTLIRSFAFYNDLNAVCMNLNGKSLEKLLEEKKFKTIITNLLNQGGLNYGHLPKGLLKFHRYPTENRTPVEEHLVEGALYTKRGKQVTIHFTVSTEHKDLFANHIDNVLEKYSKAFDAQYNISFSEQKKSTDTIAADSNNEPFIDNGKPVFRPGGHGALIENLNDLDADIVFIKNIDNVVPDRLKETTITYKKLIAGILVSLQEQSFKYLEELDNENINDVSLKEIIDFCEKKLFNKNQRTNTFSKQELISYLKGKLNRPIRVCGMVKNEGEPGGGPYLIVNKDGSISPQILESSQIDMNHERSVTIMKTATHFNPVDLVCGIKDYKGNKFDLTLYVDKNTGFISSKSKNGKELKALELPGLWNGAMSDWNTIFVEVPVLTFNPVKTVNDLLREEHQ